MKTLLIITAITVTLTANDANDTNAAWVDKQVAAIKPPRTGVSTQAIRSVKDPFIFIKPVPKSTAKSSPRRAAAKTTAAQKAVAKAPAAAKKPLQVKAILNNSALINGKWYKTDEKIRDYKIAKIDQKSVVLTRGKKEKILLISTANPKIKIQIK